MGNGKPNGEIGCIQLVLLFQDPILIAVGLQINETIHFFQRSSCLVGNFNHNLVITSHGSSSELPNNFFNKE